MAISNEVKLNECIAKLEKARAYNTFRDKRIAAFKEAGHPLPIKETLQLAESVLEKATRYVEKHNGRSDNETFTESGWSEYQNLDESTDPRELQVKNYMLTCNISEADARKVLGLPPKGLSRKQLAEYLTAVSCGISEADALRLCKV
jgi:hypothetical protein